MNNVSNKDTRDADKNLTYDLNEKCDLNVH
jgi:hypothetical protein